MKGAIAAGHGKTVEAGKIAYDLGGTAYDAAIAALIASTVTEPCMSSLGGGGFALIGDGHSNYKLLDFFCETPLNKKPKSELDFVPVTVSFASANEIFHMGMGAIAIPGMVKAIFELHEHYGTIPLKELAAPAIQYAREGIEVDWFQEFDFRILEKINCRGEYGSNIFAPNGNLLKEGDTIVQPELADVLEFLIKEGADAFYVGDLAHKIVEDSKDLGGLIGYDDLYKYELNWRFPHHFAYRDFDVSINPFPAPSGLIVETILRHLESYGDPPAFGTQDYSNLLSAALHKAMRKEESESPLKRGSTSHISTLDNLGNTVSITMSNGEGSGYFIPGTGIQMNNMMGEAALFPGGFDDWETGTRVGSMMSPVIIRSVKRNMTVSMGTGGAGRIPYVLAQLVHHFADEDLTPDEIIHRPRMHIQENKLEMEPGLTPPSDLPSSVETVNVWDELNMFFGGVHTVGGQGKKLWAVGDERRNGSSVVVS